MKKILITLAGLFLLQVGFAQTTNPVERKSSLIFTGGAAIPVGPFASTTSEDGGMANTGYNLNLQYARQLKGIGLGIHGMYSSHALKNDLEDTGLNIDIGNWTYYGITAGLLSSYPINNQKTVSFDIKAMIGAGFVNTPSIKITSDGESMEEPSRSSTTFLGEVGAGLRFKISQRAFLYGGADWIMMQPKFKYDGQSMEQKISAFNLHAGLGFNF